MKTISPTLQGYLSGSPAHYALLFTLRLRDDTIYYRTSHQFDIVAVPPIGELETARYEASNELSISAIESTAGGIAQNAEIKIVYTEDLTRDKMLAGLMDNALLIVDLVDWSHPDAGAVRIMTGVLQRKSVNDVKAGSWNLKGQVYLLDGFIGEIYSQECRNILGDANCGVDLDDFKETFTVGTVLTNYDRTRFECTIANARAEGFFALGTAMFGVGPTRYEILKDAGSGTSRTITLAIPRAEAIEVSDTGTLFAGCDKTHNSCLNKFDNVLRFRGEPFNPVGALTVTQA